MTRIAPLIGILLMLVIAPAAAQSDSFKDSVKKTEKGAGELLRGMGQELKKFGGSLTAGTKKDVKKEEKKEAKKAHQGTK